MDGDRSNTQTKTQETSSEADVMSKQPKLRGTDVLP
jgi:hypothetical protein